MKFVPYIGAGTAVFVGVLAALQVSKRLETPKEQPAVVRSSEPVYISPAQNSAPGSVDFRAAAQRVNRSVVSVDRFQSVETFFGERLGEQETGSGSGVVLGDNGIIVTNNHVVAGASRVQVRISDGRSFDARVL